MKTFNTIDIDNERGYYVDGLRVDRPVFRAMVELEIKATEKAIAWVSAQQSAEEKFAKSLHDMRDGKVSFPITHETRALYRNAEIAYRKEARELDATRRDGIAWIEELTELLED
jgi:hypothetical protein